MENKDIIKRNLTATSECRLKEKVDFLGKITLKNLRMRRKNQQETGYSCTEYKSISKLIKNSKNLSELKLRISYYGQC